MIGRTNKNNLFLILLIFTCINGINAKQIVWGNNEFILPHKLTLELKFDKLMEISPDTALLIDNIKSISYWYYSENHFFFIDNGYLCDFNLFTHKLDTLKYAPYARAFKYEADGLYILDSGGIRKNNTLVINGNIRTFDLWKGGSILFTENDSLFLRDIITGKTKLENTDVKIFTTDKYGNIIYVKNDSLFLNKDYVSKCRYTPIRLYTIKRRIIVYAKDSIYIYDY